MATRPTARYPDTAPNATAFHYANDGQTLPIVAGHRVVYGGGARPTTAQPTYTLDALCYDPAHPETVRVGYWYWVRHPRGLLWHWHLAEAV